MSFVMDRILNVDDENEEFYISFTLKTQWFDPRLVFNNLKKREDLNVLSPVHYIAIWTPTLIFYNTKSKQESTLEGSIVKVIPNTNFTFETADMSSTHNAYLFKGSENRLEISQAYNIKFICNYDMMPYPFDTQECYVDMVLTAIQDNFCTLNDKNFSYTGKLNLRQYFIRRTFKFIFSLF